MSKKTALIDDNNLTIAEQAVISLRREHATTWHDKADAYWLARLMEEVGELAGSLVGNHEGPVAWELKQIAAICINWLDKHIHEEKL